MLLKVLLIVKNDYIFGKSNSFFFIFASPLTESIHKEEFIYVATNFKRALW